jgi:hypothetical protein
LERLIKKEGKIREQLVKSEKNDNLNYSNKRKKDKKINLRYKALKRLIKKEGKK